MDLTVYLSENQNSRDGKSLGVINGMDCVPHNDILPLELTRERLLHAPIEHDLFDRLFKLVDDNNPGNLKSLYNIVSSFPVFILYFLHGFRARLY